MAVSTSLAVGLVLCVLLIPLQSAAEELIFRASGPQVVLEKVGFSKVRFWVVHLIFSLVFASVHGAKNAAAFVVFVAIALALVVLVHQTAGTESAIALHAVNNVMYFSLGLLKGKDMTGEQTETSATVAVLAQLVTITVVTLLMVLWRRRANRRLTR